MSSEGLINANRFLGRKSLTSGHVAFVCWQLRSKRELSGQINSLDYSAPGPDCCEDFRSNKNMPQCE
jgi:hypothetical protein